MTEKNGMFTKTNSHDFYEFVLSFEPKQLRATKLALDNIIDPKEQSIWKLLTNLQFLATPENHNGQFYPADKYVVVRRVLGGKVVIKADTDGFTETDTYAWKMEDFIKKLPKAVQIGGYDPSGKAFMRAVNLMNSIVRVPGDEDNPMSDYSLMAGLLANASPAGYLLIHTDAEERVVVEVTQELYDAGLTFIVDEWQTADENTGMYKTTDVEVGDFILMNHKDQTVYRIASPQFHETHTIHD